MSSNYGDYPPSTRASRSAFSSPGGTFNLELLALTIPVIALAIGLGVYVEDLKTLHTLTASGATLWQSFWLPGAPFPDLGQINTHAWVNFTPGQSLTISFATDPLTRALCAALPLGIGGLVLLFTSLNWGDLGHHQKHPGAIFGALLLLVGFCSAALPPPNSFSVNLQNQTLSTGSTVIALSDIQDFQVERFHSRHSSHSDLIAFGTTGQQATLASMAVSSDATTLQTTLQTFITSGGLSWQS
jgi:hypothetical protein